MRRLVELLLLCAVACGGRIDDGTDASIDAGGSDAKSDVIMKPDTSPPTCLPDFFGCVANSECCSQICFDGKCGTPPPPPPCKPDGVACSTDVECCSNVCNGTCGGTTVGCATTSNKKCDICVAASCCQAMVDCGNDAACSTWLGCVQNCEQQGQSAFACSQAQGTCGPPSGVTENALYKCAQQLCGNSCTVD